jgi:E3 ubiquitin-protein ligase SHPRH
VAKGKSGSGAAKVLSKVSWRRVVLDECQMVRSSTTQLAVACRCLRSDFRWMVSGTPLHQGVDDLNGELAFLGVWPFCLPDQTDGFWSHRVGVPWSRKDPEALPLLHALLRGVAVRHTKAQRRTADDTPLLTLPPAGRELRMVTHGAAIDEAPSERFVCGFLENHAAAALRGALTILSHVARLERGGSDDDDDDDALPRHARHYTAGRVNEARQLASRLLRLVRGATTSSALVRSHLRDVEQALRAAATRDAGGAGFRRDYHGHGRIDDAVAAAAVDFNRVRALPAAAALVELMTPKVRSIHWFPYDRAGVVNADP